MIKNAVAALMLAVFGFALAACEATVPSRTFPELTYQHLGPIKLNVASMEIVNAYKAPMSEPNVDHLFPTSPSGALTRWGEDRLIAAGSSGHALFTITDASVKETALAMKEGLKGAFTKDQSERYDAQMEASLEIFDDTGKSLGFANAKVSRSVTVREDATINDREQAWFDLTESMMKDINAELEKNISAYLGSYLN